ncbi:MAG: hypothetical protein KDD37_04635 [Bdellovibrionales bacterium]|nr:hypothetical protein [Bdellovibrionales bacterium]
MDRRTLLKTLCLLFIGFFSNVSMADLPKIAQPFKTDGCTASPDGTWVHCCVEHDITYWMGGTFEDRKAADRRLYSCMNLSGGNDSSQAYYNAVRIFGVHLWAKAWPKRDPNSLSRDELEDIQNELALYRSIGSPLDFEFIVQESIMFLPLTDEQRQVARAHLTEYSKTEEYKEYLQRYEYVTGQKPITLKYHN